MVSLGLKAELTRALVLITGALDVDTTIKTSVKTTYGNPYASRSGYFYHWRPNRAALCKYLMW